MVLKVSLNTGINRIRLEFKVNFLILIFCSYISINRIRLEFKGEMAEILQITQAKGINRIRLEFKELFSKFLKSKIKY